ncbi:MAG: glycosyltransferase family 4 protein [Chryseolinea sp.]
MKVLFVTNMYPVKDYIYFGIHVKEQIERLSKSKGIQADLYFIDGRKEKTRYLKSIWEIPQKINAGKYDLVHIHYGISGMFLLFHKPKIPIVITLHSGELFGKKGFINRHLQRVITMAVIRHVNRIVILNDETKTLLSDFSAKLVKQPCGVDIDFFRPLTGTSDQRRFTIGFPGNKARAEKNFRLFTQIIMLLQKEIDIEVIEFHNISRDEVLQSLNKIDLLLMTSLKEGSPQIVKEAMAVNKPVISTPVGDVEDLLKGVTNSRVVRSFEAKDFIDPIMRLYALPPELRTTNGRSKIMNMSLDAESVANKIYHTYAAI